jgi:hypothetical protein
MADPSRFNPICWFEIPVTDLDRACRFYGEVFGFSFERSEIDGNRMALFPGDPAFAGAAGALACGDSYEPGHAGPRIYFGTDALDETLAKAIKAGGKPLYPRTTVPGLGWVAEFEDSEGNAIALFMAAPEASAETN